MRKQLLHKLHNVGKIIECHYNFPSFVSALFLSVTGRCSSTITFTKRRIHIIAHSMTAMHIIFLKSLALFLWMNVFFIYCESLNRRFSDEGSGGSTHAAFGLISWLEWDLESLQVYVIIQCTDIGANICKQAEKK